MPTRLPVKKEVTRKKKKVIMTEQTDKSKPLNKVLLDSPLYSTWNLKDTVGFIMTRTQFDYLSEVMQKRLEQRVGLWTVFFYPKSAHLAIDNGFKRTICPLVGLSIDFPYYKWIHGPRMAEQWVDFAKKIQKVDTDYVFCQQTDDGQLSVVEKETGIVIVAPLDCGGGRVYHEPSARECHTNFCDILQ